MCLRECVGSRGGVLLALNHSFNALSKQTTKHGRPKGTGTENKEAPPYVQPMSACGKDTQNAQPGIWLIQNCRRCDAECNFHSCNEPHSSLTSAGRQWMDEAASSTCGSGASTMACAKCAQSSIIEHVETTSRDSVWKGVRLCGVCV